ncbi:hypothetical protein HPB52_005148 [Rhipicephalus sanguineus]|uniref:Cysteine/serine-rich nuclear protein N-terminal domain-containing protein n=1 Tax=Rhipicephalus sanguineus TaxID=34632 RepID=A0A9D4PWZ4_RHISA|nr:hypothetical protein HPB52_005148 [Rhipicephalus sanguineus]
MGDGSSLKHPLRRSSKTVTFDKVTVYEFPRVQGFGSVPTDGGMTLGLGFKHVEEYTLAIHQNVDQPRLLHGGKEPDEIPSAFHAIMEDDMVPAYSTRCDSDKPKVEKVPFPCACCEEACENPCGRRQYSPDIAHEHYRRTIARLEAEQAAAELPVSDPRLGEGKQDTKDECLSVLHMAPINEQQEESGDGENDDEQLEEGQRVAVHRAEDHVATVLFGRMQAIAVSCKGS